MGLNQTFPSATGAPLPIRIARLAAVKGAHEHLGFHNGFVFGPVSEIDVLLRMSENKTSARSGMTIVRATGGVSTPQTRGHQSVVNRPSPSTIAYREKLSIPCTHW